MFCHLLPVQRYVSAVLAVAVCLSVTNRSSIETGSRIDIDLNFRTETSFCRISYTVSLFEGNVHSM